ncbi:ATP-binding protein [Roseomonas sp. AR75]|uniref:ATP-binding protein n=1 Tax=Roseomonas sp. AR75 TaxID=2562311 RepID=UPI0010BFFC30|nr:ATP-binding protein [Roseomonas sp. AR75]
MALRIITAEERLAEERGVKAAILGKPGSGKTWLLNTTCPVSTLFIDLEAGDLAVQGWPGSSIRPRTWEECRDIALFLAGPNPALRDEQPYSAAQHARVLQAYGDPTQMDHVRTLFIDSITVAGRLCFQWCRGQPEAFSDRTGKPDVRGAYGLHGREMIAWLTHLQHARGRNVVFVGILDERLDDFNRKTFSLQIEGSKTSLELPGIVDEVLTLAEIKDQADRPFRALVCQTMNPWGYPAKDRSGRLDLLEPPDLARLFAKVTGAPVPSAAALPPAAPPATDTAS